MIKSLTVTNFLGESLKLELGFPEKSGFLIQKISGLGPAKANINSTQLSTSDGSVYNSARVNSRNIVLSLKLLGTPTIEDTRQKSYKYFPIKQRVKLLFETDNRTCEIYGYVESNEPDIFSSKEATQISIICPNPYFYSTEDHITIFAGLIEEFTFPFESTTEVPIEMGTVVMNTVQSVYYDGDSEIGVFIEIYAIGSVTNVTIYNQGTNESMKIDTVRLAALTGDGIINGDAIFISTLKGNKFIRLFRNGAYTNILNCLDKNVDWFHLTKGDNLFAFNADLGGENLQFRITNQIIYEGV